MSGSRRKSGNGQDKAFHIQWLDNATFKVELEGQNLSDNVMEEWGPYMDAQFEKRFGDAHAWPQLKASSLNFGRNDLSDEGVALVVDYLRRRDVGVQLLKFFKNNIGDGGAHAIGQFLVHSHQPVHEVHLSHNYVTEQGAFSLMTAIAQSRAYPYLGSDRQVAGGYQPIWLRIEHNCINWSSIEHRLDQAKVRWCASESHDGWTPKDLAPMVCMHQSYRSQASSADQKRHAAAAEGYRSPAMEQSGQNLLAALQGGSFAGNHDALAEDAAAAKLIEESDVPMYIFLDWSAVFEMMEQEEGRLFSFKGLLNLCQKGLMTCIPPQGRQVPPKEGERIIFVVTDLVMEELTETTGIRSAAVRKRIEWLRYAEDSYMNICHSWGILEVLETKLHTQLMKLEPRHEQIAWDMRISKKAVKVFDFACLWESQIESAGHVFFVTANDVMKQFGDKMASSAEFAGGRPLVVLHLDDLDQRFFADRVTGCHKLHGAAFTPKTQKGCNAILSAPLLSAVIQKPTVLYDSIVQGHQMPAVAITPNLIGGNDSDANTLRQELQEALNLLVVAREHLLPGNTNGEVARCLARMDDAEKRWQDLLS